MPFLKLSKSNCLLGLRSHKDFYRFLRTKPQFPHERQRNPWTDLFPAVSLDFCVYLYPPRRDQISWEHCFRTLPLLPWQPVPFGNPSYPVLSLQSLFQSSSILEKESSDHLLNLKVDGACLSCIWLYWWVLLNFRFWVAKSTFTLVSFCPFMMEQQFPWDRNVKVSRVKLWPSKIHKHQIDVSPWKKKGMPWEMHSKSLRVWVSGVSVSFQNLPMLSIWVSFLHHAIDLAKPRANAWEEEPLRSGHHL